MYGSRIKELRLLKGLTQKDLAIIMNFKSASAVGMIEREKRELSLDSLLGLSAIFNVSTDFLLGKTYADGSYFRLLFAAKMKEKRKRDKLSIEDVCTILDMSKEDLVSLENCIPTINLFFLSEDIAKFIGLKPKDANNFMNFSFPRKSNFINNNSNRPIAAESNIVLDQFKVKQHTEIEKIPLEFTDTTEALKYIKMHQIFSSEGFDVNKLSDKEVLEFGNALLEQMKMVSYKYKK